MVGVMKVLVVLQCAYGDTERRREEISDRDVWLAGLWKSYSGKRLKEMLPDEYDCIIINSTEEIGCDSAAIYPPDLEYIESWVNKTSPDIIVGCGKIAQRGLLDLGVEFVSAPHPAWRMLSKEKTAQILSIIRNGGRDE